MLWTTKRLAGGPDELHDKVTRIATATQENFRRERSTNASSSL
jgi:hypothetical protein